MLARTVAICALSLAPLPSQDASSVTEPGRALLRPLAMFLGGRARGDVPERTSIILVDPTASLQSAGFADALAAAVAENSEALARTRLGVAVVGVERPVVLDPTLDHAAVLREVRARLGRPSAEFQNVYAAIRDVAAALVNTDGERSLLLVTLENGDVEDDLEQTVAMLRRAKVQFTAITTEACVADSYWAARPYQERPRGTTLQGGDAPVIDLPWGWLFQITVANEVTPAACGPFALNRLAATTNGRVHLFSTPNEQGHVCAIYSACLFCSGDHLPQEEAYQDGRVTRLLPSTLARDDALRELGQDPYFRAVVQTWKRAADEGLLRSAPPVRLSSTSATADRQRSGRPLDLTSGASFERHAKQAERSAADAADIGAFLDAQLERIGDGQGSPRQEASAQFTRVMLQLTRVNLLLYAGWCRDVAPRQLAAASKALAPPEVAVVDGGGRPVGVGFSSMCLCHGVRPFLEVELPGGDAVRGELERLAALTDRFMERYSHTQYGFALHRSGIARFHFVYPGIAGNVPRQRPKSGSEEGPVTTPRPTRPARGAASGTGSTGGPQTGGGR